MKLPLVWFTVFFCLGIVFTSLVKISFLFVYILAVVLLVLSLLFMSKRWAFAILLLALAFLLGAILFKSHLVLPRRHISKFIAYKNNQPYLVKGIIISQPTEKFGRTSFILEAKEIHLGSLKYHSALPLIFLQ